MFRTYARSVAWAAGFCLAATGCAAPSNDGQDAPVPEVEIEEPLTLTVDALDIRHGSLRIEASMLDGSADVSMWLGPECEAEEVGRGIATRSGFAWSLSGREVSRAIECSLVVKAHAVDDDGVRVLRVAPLAVGVSLVADGAEDVAISRQEPSGTETKLTFTMPSRAGHLHIDGSVIGAEDEEEESPVGDTGVFVRSFVVSNDDLARSMLHRRQISVLGEHFLATVSVGALTLDVSEPEPEVQPEPEPAPAVSESYDEQESYGDG